MRRVLRLRWQAYPLATGHWSNVLQLPDGFSFAVRHTASGATVYRGKYYRPRADAGAVSPPACLAGSRAGPRARAPRARTRARSCARRRTR